MRRESPADADAIRRVTFEAFESMPFAGGNEHELVDALRAAGALVVSLVAELDERVVGHIAFSPARAADGSSGWYALGPVSVLPAYQRSGIGSALIRAGLQEISALGAIGCILTGNPDYYSRFGFERAPNLAPPAEPAEYFMVRTAGAADQSGPFSFHEAFYGAG